jgi:AcrR family transcriptional regulator
MPTPQNLTLRARKKAESKAAVLDVAHRLFRADSFDTTTLETICAQASISKRTFFRYFRDKEALVFPHREDRLEAFVQFLSANEQIEKPFEALRGATRVFGAQYHQNREHLMTQQAIIRSSQALLAREREIDLDWERAIARAFASRAGNAPEDDLWARVSAGAIIGVVRSTMTYWFEHGCRDDLTELGMAALDALELGFPSNQPAN